MFGFIRRIQTLEDRVKKLEEVIVEMNKKTISQKTMEEEAVTFSQIVDEWLNGKEEGNGN